MIIVSIYMVKQKGNQFIDNVIKQFLNTIEDKNIEQYFVNIG